MMRIPFFFLAALFCLSSHAQMSNDPTMKYLACLQKTTDALKATIVDGCAEDVSGDCLTFGMANLRPNAVQIAACRSSSGIDLVNSAPPDAPPPDSQVHINGNSVLRP